MQDLYEIIIGLISIMVFVGGLFGFLLVRLIRSYDEKFRKLFDRTDDLSGIETDIEWLKKNGRK